MGRKSKKEGICVYVAFPGGSVVKNPPANTEDAGSIPGSERSPGEENDNPLQYSCLENSMDRGPWRATVHEIAAAAAGLPFLSPMHESERESEVAQSCLTLSDPMDCSPRGSSVHGIFQAKGKCKIQQLFWNQCF